MPKIRNAVVSDLPYLYEICNLTGLHGGDASHLMADKNLLGHLFVAPYVVKCPDWSWVVVDHGVPVGYFVSTPDTQEFYRWMEKSWVPSLRDYCGSDAQTAKSDFENMLRGMVKAEQVAPSIADLYPSHIHTNLLPDYQRQGLGSQFFSRYHARLVDSQIAGTHIGVAKDNWGAMIFYEKQGYKRLSTQDWGVYFGRLASTL